jgi:putative ABC transport system permease protein
LLVWTIIKVAFKSIWANKMRSFLTMLGVIIGVGAVIAMMGLGSGIREAILASVRGMGANLLVVRPGSHGGFGVRDTQQQNLKLEDAEAILQRVPAVEMIAPELSGSYQVKYLSRNARVSIRGTSVTYFPVRNYEVEKGRPFTEAETDRYARVAVIGPKTATDLFEAQDPIGETIKINGINFLVVGVTKSKGEGWGSPDEIVMIPYTTSMGQLFGRDALGSLNIRIKSDADMVEAMEKITEVMRRQHRIQAGNPDDFDIRNMQEMADQLEMVGKALKWLLSSVAAISLIVGGIGIMNIMLVTVTERTREIGVRKALGARNIDVLSQFLLEAVVISVTGGVIGASIGVAVIFAFNNMAAKNPQITFTARFESWPIIVAFAVSVLVGIFFGWYPARKAASLDPIDALRYE